MAKQMTFGDDVSHLVYGVNHSIHHVARKGGVAAHNV